MTPAPAISATALLERVAALSPVIRNHAAENERIRHLAPAVVEAMVSAGLFRMLNPRALGGFEVDPVSAMTVIEEVARLDSAAGWNLQLSTGIMPLLAWFPDEGVAEVWSQTPDVIFAGTLFPPGTAAPVEGGYRVSGRWPIVSGCQNCSWIIGPTLMMNGDQPHRGSDGEPVQLIVAYPAQEAEIIDTWHTSGMRGTGSHDVAVKDLFVPSRRCAVLAPLTKPATQFRGPLWKLTIWTAIAALSVPALAIGRAAVDALIELGKRKTPAYTQTPLQRRPVVQLQVAKAEALLGAARAYLHDSLHDAWRTANQEQMISREQKMRIQLAASFANQAAAEAVDLVHAAAGTSSIRTEQPFQQHFRDVHTLTQHAFASASRYESVGKLLLGVETDWPFFEL
jgi:alkylation response protein AidB-like acyl-CoA dehydrogenase